MRLKSNLGTRRGVYTATVLREAPASAATHVRALIFKPNNYNWNPEQPMVVAELPGVWRNRFKTSGDRNKEKDINILTFQSVVTNIAIGRLLHTK